MSESKSGQDLTNELAAKRRDMQAALAACGTRGKEWAKAERTYRVALKKQMVIERDKGTPVSIISDICRGEESIADLKEKRDIAWVMYQSALEAVNVYKIEARQLETEYRTEWNRS